MIRSPRPWPKGVRARCALVAGLMLIGFPAQAALEYQRGPDGRMRLRSIPDDRPQYQYACLWTRAGVDSAESQIAAHTLAEATGYATHKFGDYPVKCRELKPGDPLAAATSVSPQSHPFAGLTMGEYFDAIYNGDRFEVRRQDKQYLGQYVSGLQGAFGNNAFWRNMMGAMGIDKATLVTPTIRAYMWYYDSIYASCLRSDAASFRRVESTFVNGNVVSSRETGVSRVNREFASAFEYLFQSNTDGPGGLGPIGNGNPVWHMDDAVQKMMKTRRCNDPSIKKFEAHLLEMFNEYREALKAGFRK